MSGTRKRLAGAVGLAVVASGLLLVPSPAQAASSGLVINEVYGGGGAASGSPAYRADFVELLNRGATPVTLDGLSLQYRSATYTGSGSVGVAPLEGEVPAGASYLVQVSTGSFGPELSPAPDYTTTTALSMAATGGQVLLVDGTSAFTAIGDLAGNASLVDMVGFGATPTSFETARTGIALDNTKSVQRTGADTDNNSADFAAPATPTPAACGAACAAPLEATSPGTKHGVVGTAITSFDLAATGGATPYTWDATGLPPGLAVSDSGTVSGTPTTAGTYPVTATVTDAADATDDVTFDIDVVSDAFRTIAQIQGTGARSPMAPESGTGAGAIVTTEGVVTGLYADPYPTEYTTNGGFDGMYIQTPGPDTDGASDAIFVYGSNSMPDGVQIGDSVEVIGAISEFGGLTEITPAEGGVTEIGSIGTATARVVAYPTTETAREAREGELLAPTDTFTVTNSYSTNQYGEVGLATGNTPLVQPTEVKRDDDTAGLAAVKADNAARGVVLDDGTSINFLPRDDQSQIPKGLPLPWLTQDNVVRVGAEATFHEPVILDYRFGWKFQPTLPVKNAGTNVVTFEDTRADNTAPQDVGGDLKLATFNVLNYFNTTGEQYVANGATLNPKTHCTYYSDRDGIRIGNNRCGRETPGQPQPNDGSGPRGAATTVSFQRQQAKIVNAINTLGADIVGLEEVENSIKLPGETNRDDALAALVAALNAAAGPGTWAYVRSPAEATTPSAISQQDLIRPAFIYKPAKVRAVGESDILFDTTEFTNAREPLAQVFKPRGALNSDAFAVVVNHFKSKGDSETPATGDNANSPDTGAFNGDRVRQATKLAEFANAFAQARGADAVFLAGDFNSYTQEDPMHVLYGAGYDAIESAGEESYSFGGLSGSLDHVLGNAAAMDMVTGADIWDINAAESVGYQYSRYNYNVTQLFDATNPFAASDHNPEIVGINTADAPYAEVNLLNINDFHGRIDSNTTRFASTVEQLRQAEGEGNTLFLSAGDNIGASLFASASQDDQPTIDVLNALDLRTSAVGNHEFDRGWADLEGRVQDEADFSYLGANVYAKGTTNPVLDEYDTFRVDGETVGVIGVVTQETPSLVSPAAIADLDFGDPVAAVNRVAAQLSDGNPENGEADVIVAEYHDGAGAGTPDGATLEEEVADGGAFADIVTETSPEVDAIFTGHTHKEYAWDAPVPGEPGETRPILQTGSYGERIGQIVLTVDRATGDVVAYTQRNVPRMAGEDLSYPRVQQVKQITDAAIADAAVIGNQPVATVTADITRAFNAGVGDNRAAESALGELVANALRDGIPAHLGQADLGITNPGGMRDELKYAGNTTSNPANTDGVVTFAEANAVLPFVNNVWLVDLTGAQLKEVLEQQWQTNPGGPAPARPYLQLGLSDNVEVTADASKPAGSRITSIRIDGQPVSPAGTYTVSTFSFLGTGGDNFRAFTQGESRDTGLVDRDLWIQYLDDSSPVAPDFARQQVFETGLPASVSAGDAVDVTLGPDLASPAQPNAGETLDLTSLGSPANTSVVVTAHSGGSTTALGTFPVGSGTAHVQFNVPGNLNGAGRIEMVAQPSGTTVTVPLLASSPPPPSTVSTTTAATAEPMEYGTDGTVHVTVTPATASGAITVLEGADTVASGTLANGTGTVTIDGEALAPGSHTLTVRYAGNATHEPSQTTVNVTVSKAGTTLDATAAAVQYGSAASVEITATPASATGGVMVSEGGETLGEGTLGHGAATVTIEGGALAPGSHTLTVRYAGDDHHAEATTTVTLQVSKAASSTSASTSPGQIRVESGTASITVTVDAGDVVPTGRVTAVAGGERLASGQLHDGEVALEVGPFGRVGMKSIEIRYAGDDHVAASTTTTSVRVVKAEPTLTADHRPEVVKAGRTRAKLTVKVTADGFTPGGFVEITLPGGDTLRVRLEDGKAAVRLPRFANPGRKVVTVTYEGNDKTESASIEHTIRVVER